MKLVGEETPVTCWSCKEVIPENSPGNVRPVPSGLLKLFCYECTEGYVDGKNKAFFDVSHAKLADHGQPCGCELCGVVRAVLANNSWWDD